MKNEIEGVIERVNEEEKTVRVKLFPEIYANFPYVLFTDTEKIKQGQRIKYMVKQDTEGCLCQEIIPMNKIKEHPDKELIINIVENFKYKKED